MKMSEKVPMILLSVEAAQAIRQLLSYTVDYLEENKRLLHGDYDVIQANSRYYDNLLAKLIDIYRDDPPEIVDNMAERMIERLNDTMTADSLPPHIKVALINAIRHHGQTDKDAVLTDDSKQAIFNEMRRVLFALLRVIDQLDMMCQIIDVLEQDGKIKPVVKEKKA